MTVTPTDKARILIEALSFLKTFHHTFTVVKLGGEAIERPAVLDSLLTDLVWLEQVGLRPVLVHGGGKSISRAMQEAGIEPRWHNGRRITDADTMAIVQREVERLNGQLVNRLFDLGGAAIGMVPSRHRIVRGGATDTELGLVGSPTQVDEERLLRYASRGLIPVIPPLSVADDDQILNTNADDVALAIAEGLNAAKLVFCSNVGGVLQDPEDPASRIPSLRASEITGLIETGGITGGMIPKLQNCLGALAAGVGKIHIVDAATPHAMLLEIFTAEGIGTELVQG